MKHLFRACCLKTMSLHCKVSGQHDVQIIVKQMSGGFLFAVLDTVDAIDVVAVFGQSPQLIQFVVMFIV